MFIFYIYLNISFYKLFRILHACSSSIEEFTKLQSFPFTENPVHTFHDFFSKTFVFIASKSIITRAWMHRGANWIQNNRVSISIRAQCLYTQVPSPYLDTRLNKRSSYICDWLPSVFVSLSRLLSRLDLSYLESDRLILQFIIEPIARSSYRSYTLFPSLYCPIIC